MPATICPTVTAYDPHEYRRQLEVLLPFAKRVHIDLMDGEFAPTKSPPLEQIWWPPELIADIHLMYQRPMDPLEQLIKLKPHLVVIHAEAEIDHRQFATALQAAGIKVGLALLQTTTVEDVESIISNFDQVLVYSGDLGRHGGQADLGLLDKVRKIRATHPEVEIAWDGGINDQNARALTAAGVSILNVGGFIQQSADPAAAYAKLEALLG